MGRQLIIAFTLFSAVFMVQSFSEEDRDARDTCLKEHGFSEEPRYVSAFKTIDIRAKCYATCLLRKTEMMKEDGSIDLNKILEKMSDTKNNDIDFKKSLVIPCTERKGTNDCDTGHQVVTCVAAAVSKLSE